MDPGLYPLLEVYLRNQSENQTVEFTRCRLNSAEVKALTGEVVWTQFYPTAIAKPGETVLLQINVAQNPKVDQTLEVETKQGQRIAAKLGPFQTPPSRLTAVTFSSNFHRAFIAWSSKVKDQAPTQLVINGKDCAGKIQIMELPGGRARAATEERQGLLAVDLPTPAAQGIPMHVRLQFADGTAAQALLRASQGIFLDAFHVPEKDKKLRDELGLDAAPSAKMIEGDPACTDVKAGKKYGLSMPAILAARNKLYASTNTHHRLSYIYMCTVATPNKAYSVYGQCVDALQVNPYQLQYSQSPKFIESEEMFFRWAWQGARPRPWYWIPEAFAADKRILEPGELRLLTYAALGRGCKGIKYFIYDPKTGFQNSPPLTAEIKAINHEIKTLEPILSPAIPLAVETIGNPKDGIRVYTLASGDRGLIVIIRTLAYQTDRQPNQWGAAPRFKFTPKSNVKITIQKPKWLTVGAITEPLADGKTSLTHRVKDDLIELELSQLDLARVLWIENAKPKTEKP